MKLRIVAGRAAAVPVVAPAPLRTRPHGVGRTPAPAREETLRRGLGNTYLSNAHWGGGQPLPLAERGFFEARFGRDFRDVRVHTGVRAAAAARALDAHAFTSGRDVVFGEGRYRPGTAAGRWLLAHELAHVAQQNGRPGPVRRLRITPEAKAAGTCGERLVQWRWTLDKPAPVDGYIVQHIAKGEFVKSCPDIAFGPPHLLLHFWEAWPVAAGVKDDRRWTDGSTTPARPGENGVQISTGTLAYFPRSVTGDLGDFNRAPADPKSPWRPGLGPGSGSLPSTLTRPAWWDTVAPLEGPADREASSRWNCCDPDPAKRTSTVQSRP
ncbi:DUF4157 domain-containing protein [Streptomyces sp. ODS28]|uniref:eCIS core domain-containing protein n=1 Tax=Streptomyces sp. ODS28 TaxID=3136688 RepID=UPI0031ECA14D